MASSIVAMLLRRHPEQTTPGRAHGDAGPARDIACALLAWIAAFAWVVVMAAGNLHDLASPYTYVIGVPVATPAARIATRRFRRLALAHR